MKYLIFRIPFILLGLCLNTTVYASYASPVSEFVGTSLNCALKSNGSIACWGWKGFYAPPTGNDFIQVSVGFNGRACALKSNGSIACWGWEGLDGTPPTGNDFTQVSVGDEHACALKNNGSIACWGRNFSDGSTPPTGNDFTQVSVRWQHACALKSNGSIACWRRNFSGESTLPTGNDFTQISVGFEHACALKNNGSIACWGDDGYAQRASPAGNNFTQVSVGERFTCVLKNDSRIACWGNNDRGRSTTYLMNDSNFNFIQVSTGLDHGCALKNYGHIVCWGGQYTKRLTAGNSSMLVNRISSHAVSPKGNDFIGGYNDQFCLNYLTNTYPYAILSQGVYEGNNLEDWNEWIHVFTATDQRSGYRASVYKNDLKKEVVIAYSGTDDFKDFITDAIQIPGIIVPEQYWQGLVTAYIVLTTFDYSVVLTGHSLGGGIAQFVAGSFNQKAITFNPAPINIGSNMLTINVHVHEYFPELVGPLFDILNIVTRDENGKYDLISSSSGLLFGTTRYLDVTVNEGFDLTPEWIERHSIDTIVERLEECL